MRYTQTVGRLQFLTKALLRSPSNNYYKPSKHVIPIRLCSTSSKVTIGGVSKDVKSTLNPELVPTKYLKHEDSQVWLRHMRWMLQKDNLGQDIFLIGPPGPLRHTLAMSYLELTNREVEYVTLTRDTTDSDLKQRREIKGGTSFYHDQSAVRAATKGRVLILEGIEKAERNVLPVLNNLLENREMQLEDGRLLIPAHRYDNLLKDHSSEELESMKLERVSEDFRVIALGLPSPPYLGHPLDPPLRSRFQARDVSTIPFKEHLQHLQEEHGAVSSGIVTRVLSYAHSLLADEAKALSLPDFPVNNLSYILSIMEKFPGTDAENLLSLLYPYKSFMQNDGQTSVNELLTTFDLKPTKSKSDVYEIKDIQSHSTDYTAEVQVNINGQLTNTKVHSGGCWTGAPPSYEVTPYHSRLLTELLQSHAVRDFCIIGPKGCGKSAAVAQLAHLLGYQTEPILLYQDMTSRDLVQQRVTTPEGDTTWQLSPLVIAATEGKMAILDGLHRLHHGTLAVLHRLLHDRELHLYDGSRLLRHDRYDAIKQEHDLTDAQLAEKGVMRIHPAFRVVGLAEPPQIGATQGQWLNPESLTLFLYHEMTPLTQAETADLVSKVVGETSPIVSQLISLTGKFSASSDPALKSLAQSLSLRQILRIARRFQAYPAFDLHTAVYKACLARFLPSLAKQTLDTSLEESNITKPSPLSPTAPLACQVEDGVLRIGNTHTPIYKPQDVTKIPQTLFFDIQQHISVLENMLQDWLLGDHLLLVGNQGVGKNKLADRFLYLLNRPREYIQLHRDTTVQSLTLQPTVKDGRIVHEDSPLVCAVTTGNVLVVDEADKAPTNVTCVLKTLVESGEMLLSDGRRIVPPGHPLAASQSSQVIVSHPDFRMIVLANRPGFPFLGNDFFGALGDLFSCHAIDNPSPESEMALLRSYGPDVPKDIMWKLVGAFGELRDLADQGLIQYPYSTREVVNIVKHLQAFPNEGVASVVRNVFDFDTWAGEAKETLVRVMQAHGIPVGASPNNIDLAKKYPLSPPSVTGAWRINRQSVSDASSAVKLDVTVDAFKLKSPIYLNVEQDPMSAAQIRATSFSEQESMWMIPLYETSLITDLATTVNVDGDDVIYVGTVSPFAVYFFIPNKSAFMKSVQLHSGHFNANQTNAARVRIAPLSADRVAFYEETTNTLMVVSPESGIVYNVPLMSSFETVSERIRNVFGGRGEVEEQSYRMCKDLSENGQIIIWQYGGRDIQCVDFNKNNIYSITSPYNLKSLTTINPNEWLISTEDGERFILKGLDDDIPNNLYPIKEFDNSSSRVSTVLHISDDVNEVVLSTALQQKLSAPSSLIASDKDLAHIIVGFPELDSSDNEIWTWPRKSGFPPKLPVPSVSPTATSTILPESGQVIRVLENLPPEVSDAQLNRNIPMSYLEVVDLLSRNVSYIPVPRTVHPSAYWRYAAGRFAAPLLLSKKGKDGLVTVDSAGGMRLWQTGIVGLEKALQEWRSMIGYDDAPLRMERERESGLDVSSPKHGKVDENNDPHVGGNQWAGGTGGRDTAGLGGKGGPYRLDAGHDVHQVPEFEKDAVPEEVRKAAREMGRKAFEQRLREIQMSEYDANLYDKLASKVTTQVRSLRGILTSLQARSKERQWLRHRTEGELDDTKLIEGLAGERNIYRLRREEEPEIGAPQTKPKRLRLLVDVSGSMYRFNGHDGRLERELEVTLMVMEAFEGFEAKFKYDVYGHSGEDMAVPLVTIDEVPKNNKERLDILKTMQAHAQFCLSGDHTIHAARHAIKDIVKEDADEHFVILLSDANLERYGIRPKVLADVFAAEPDVRSYAIFIGSLGNQADRLTKALPAGRSFTCLDLVKLPQIMQQIFTSAVLT